jgi:uncharacterized protein YcaQ
MRPLELDLTTARRLAVAGQLLALPRPRAIEDVVRGLGSVQIDPTRVLARTEHLLLFSRLGRRFRIAELERLLWDEHALFEYRAHILPSSDLPLHRPVMRGYPKGDSSRHRYVREWLRANAAFRRYVLIQLRDRGPLRTRDLEDRTVAGWRTGGWNDDGNDTAMMLEALWRKGEVMIAGRDGQQRLWDLAERRLPAAEPDRPVAEVARELVGRQLRTRGVAQANELGRAIDGSLLPGRDRALAAAVREGIAVPARIEALAGEWLAHGELLERPFRGRTVLVSPFDDLIEDRQRTQALFDFEYRIEIYVPKAKRHFGYYVLPILHGERLIGRIDPIFDRRAGVLRVNGIWAEADAPGSAGPRMASAIEELGSWLGAREIAFGRTMPAMWRRSIRA